jgi:hypothetical protein
MKMDLEQMFKNGWLVKHTPSKEEITDLLGVIDRDLESSRVPGLSPDWQLNIAYNAALQIAITALAASGYRPGREAHHYRAIESLEYTMDVDAETVNLLDSFRKKRNFSGYDRAGTTSAQEADEMYKLAHDLRQKIDIWLRTCYPQFIE